MTSHSVPQYIYPFDVEDECFQSVPPPLEVESPERTKLGISLGVLEGFLAICESPKNDGRHFHIWVMKDYGVQVSWAKAYNIEFTMIKNNVVFHPHSTDPRVVP